jgi:hypothetical protein
VSSSEDVTFEPGESRRILARVVRLFRPYRTRVLGVAALILVSSGLGVLDQRESRS